MERTVIPANNPLLNRETPLIITGGPSATSDPTLTEEELAEIERDRDAAMVGATFGPSNPITPAYLVIEKHTLRLIAALRASREEVERLRQCVEWARWHINEEWPNGPTGDGANWARFVAVADTKEGDPPELWWVRTLT